MKENAVIHQNGSFTYKDDYNDIVVAERFECSPNNISNIRMHLFKPWHNDDRNENVEPLESRLDILSCEFELLKERVVVLESFKASLEA